MTRAKKTEEQAVEVQSVEVRAVGTPVPVALPEIEHLTDEQIMERGEAAAAFEASPEHQYFMEVIAREVTARKIELLALGSEQTERFRVLKIEIAAMEALGSVADMDIRRGEGAKMREARRAEQENRG